MSLYMDESRPSFLQRQYAQGARQFRSTIAAKAVPDAGIQLKQSRATPAPSVEIIEPVPIPRPSKLVKFVVPKPPVPEQFAKDFTFIQNSFRGFQKTRINRLIVVIAKHFGTSSKMLKSQSREKQYITPRFLAIYLIRTLTNPRVSFPEIGRIFGGRDHSTTINSYYKVEYLRNTDSNFDDVVKGFEVVSASILRGEVHGDFAGRDLAWQNPNTASCPSISPSPHPGGQFKKNRYFRNSRQVGSITPNDQSLALHAHSKSIEFRGGAECDGTGDVYSG